MSRNLEIEVKGLLSKEEYELILSNFDKQKCYEQINYYIDTKEFLIRAKNCGLRIREKLGKYELTLKVKQSEGKLEINEDLTAKDVELFGNCGVFPGNEVKAYLVNNLQIPLQNLFIFVDMKTTRLDIPYNDSLISLDKSICLGETDYEIECESVSLSKAKKDLESFLLKYSLKYKKFSSSKLRRAIERYKARQ